MRSKNRLLIVNSFYIVCNKRPARAHDGARLPKTILTNFDIYDNNLCARTKRQSNNSRKMPKRKEYVRKCEKKKF